MSSCKKGGSGKGEQKGLEGSQSKLFYRILKVRDLLQKHTALKVFIIIGNVFMDIGPQGIISDILGCRPVRINASGT